MGRNRWKSKKKGGGKRDERRRKKMEGKWFEKNVSAVEQEGEEGGNGKEERERG